MVWDRQDLISRAISNDLKAPRTSFSFFLLLEKDSLGFFFTDSVHGLVLFIL